jgi:outer membrane lipoprotein-sorting protein
MIRQTLQLLVIGGLLAVTLAANAPNDAAQSLTAHLNALKDTTTLTAQFICQKKLAALETPLLSRGQLWIQKGDAKSTDAAIRFSTEKPYTSELILTGGKVLARSQHETEWTKTNQSTRPGLTAVMSQLAGWSTGDPGKLTEMYDIKHSSVTLSFEETTEIQRPGAATQRTEKHTDTDLYLLTPTNKDLIKAIKQITFAIDPKTHFLLMLEILTQQDDTTQYHFYNVEANKPLPENIFSPNTTPPSATAPAK